MNDTRDEFLENLREDQLRDIVLIPLFSQMGFQDVIEYHGAAEKGKDIICRFRDMAGEMRYVGIVAKRTDIHGSVGKAGNAGEVLLQVQQTFDSPYTGIFDLKEVVIDECWIVTSGLIKPTAIESIQGTLKKSNLDKLVRFIDRRKLCTLIDRHMPAFWRSDRLLSLVLHEMRAPISSARAWAQVLELMVSKEDPIDKNRVQKISENITLQMELVDRLLESNSIFTASGLSVRTEEVDLNEIVEGVVKRILPLAGRRYGEPRSLEFRRASSSAICEIDSRMVSQAIWNLLDNAVKYGSPQRPATVAIEIGDHSFSVVVSDFGIGVPPEAVERIMQPLYRAENAVRLTPSGVGLGLTIAERVARAHGGAVVIRSCQNPTVFVLVLPKRRPR